MPLLSVLGRILAAAALSAAALAEPPAVSAAPEEQTREVARWLTGAFSNRNQATQDSAFFEVVLHMSPIWTQRDGEYWLYVEQALASTPAQPYRQRVYRIHWEGNGPVSEVFTLPGDLSTYVGAWRDPSVFAKLTPHDLRRKDGCSLHLARSAEGSYRGSTQGNACASDRSGATYATSEVTLDASVLTSWDRGFDDHGKQAWGSTAGPYRFERQPAS